MMPEGSKGAGTNMRAFVRVVCLASAFALQACSVSTPVRLAVPREGALPSAVALDLGKQASPALNAFAARFARALDEGGVTVSPDASYRLTLALSAQPAGAGVTSQTGSDPKSIAWQSAPRRKGEFENCTAERLRAVVTGSPSLNASPSLIAEAELDTCKDRAVELDRLALALAGRITRR